MVFDVGGCDSWRVKDLITEHRDSFNMSFHTEYGSPDPFINYRTRKSLLRRFCG